MNEKNKLPECANAPGRGFTAEDIEQAVRICGSKKNGGSGCFGCPLRGVTRCVNRLFEELAAENARLREENRWIPVTERKPELTTWRDPVNDPPEQFEPVLVCRIKDPGKPPIVEQGYRDLGGWWKVYGTRVKKIIGWMPMPGGVET